jgi:hypothetical protein
MADPAEYYKYDKLNLYFKDPKDCSLDEAGAEKYKKDKTKANAPGTYAQQVQTDLIALGYLAKKADNGEANDDGYYGRGSARAVLRFQRHAGRLYRMDLAKAIKDVKADAAFKGKVDGICNSDTAKEIRKWVDNKWVNPVGRFKTKALTAKLGGNLREDAADAWEKVVKDVTAAGGTLDGPYGGSLRGLDYGGADKKAGTSDFSFHYCGRAVDIRQEFANPPEKTRRYYVISDPQGGDQYWTLFCKTDKQDGTQGVQIKKGDKKRWDFADKKDVSLPEGYYLDLTAAIQKAGEFERIKAHKGWESNYNKCEWWHFQFIIDRQETFSDELELIGFDEAALRKVKNQAGTLKWPDDAHLDHRPG